MGQLTRLKQATETVTLKSGEQIVFRGLSFEDFWIIAMDHGPQATLLFNKIVNKEKFDYSEVRAIFQGLLPQMPSMVAAVIALAADEHTPDGVEAAKRLSALVQLESLEKIFKLTIEGEAELKQLGELLVRLMSGATGFAQQMRAPLSEAGFGELGNA